MSLLEYYPLWLDVIMCCLTASICCLEENVTNNQMSSVKVFSLIFIAFVYCIIHYKKVSRHCTDIVSVSALGAHRLSVNASMQDDVIQIPTSCTYTQPLQYPYNHKLSLRLITLFRF